MKTKEWEISESNQNLWFPRLEDNVYYLRKLLHRNHLFFHHIEKNCLVQGSPRKVFQNQSVMNFNKIYNYKDSCANTF